MNLYALLIALSAGLALFLATRLRAAKAHLAITEDLLLTAKIQLDDALHTQRCKVDRALWLLTEIRTQQLPPNSPGYTPTHPAIIRIGLHPALAKALAASPSISDQDRQALIEVIAHHLVRRVSATATTA